MATIACEAYVPADPDRFELGDGQCPNPATGRIELIIDGLSRGARAYCHEHEPEIIVPAGRWFDVELIRSLL